jgi:RNA polymerase sigma factor (TIGR02999 family)
MNNEYRDKITQVLREISVQGAGGWKATDWLFEVLYEELRRIAGTLMRAERPAHTLQPTALVNEAYIRLADQTNLQWENRAHFLGIAARAMRQVLVAHARQRSALKRGGDCPRLTLADDLGQSLPAALEILALEEALTRLGKMSDRIGRVVELRVFAGMKMAEIAHVLDVSKRTAANDWSFAKKWLSVELAGPAP